ncbi:hypothetical protein DFR33_109197 [Bradymonas sediminis]|nr:hypothetical protein DFR33_109197 [Bradymonas sediminis]
MTRKILSNLIVLLALTVVGVPMSHAQGKGQAENAASKADKAEQKGKRGEKLGKGAKLDKVEREKLKEMRKEVRAERREMKKAHKVEAKGNAVAAKQKVREMRRLSGQKVKGIDGRVLAHKKQNMQLDKELQKHAKRVAKINRLKQISEQNKNEKLGERAEMLMAKETKRHTRRLSKLTKVQVSPKKEMRMKRREAIKNRMVIPKSAESKNIQGEK